MNPNLKYQIFVSSTYEDLKAEREKVIRAILEMGHIPVGMEMFSAGDEEQWKLIQKQIDDCDYYVVIVAHKYGSTDGNISYTEKEYDYAASKGIPILGFIIDNKAEIAPHQMENDNLKKEKLMAFKEKVKGKIINHWESKEDLYGKVSIALMKQFNTNAQVGWVRANELVDGDVTKELSRLSTENSALRDQLNILNEKVQQDDTSKYNKIISILKKHKIELSFFYEGGSKFEDKTYVSFYRVLTLIAPEMINSSNELPLSELSSHIGFMLRPDTTKRSRDKNPIPTNIMKEIVVDFQTLELFRPSDIKSNVDMEQYWQITDLGIKVFQAIRRRVMEGIA